MQMKRDLDSWTAADVFVPKEKYTGGAYSKQK